MKSEYRYKNFLDYFLRKGYWFKPIIFLLFLAWIAIDRNNSVIIKFSVISIAIVITLPIVCLEFMQYLTYSKRQVVLEKFRNLDSVFLTDIKVNAKSFDYFNIKISKFPGFGPGYAINLSDLLINEKQIIVLSKSIFPKNIYGLPFIIDSKINVKKDDFFRVSHTGLKKINSNDLQIDFIDERYKNPISLIFRNVFSEVTAKFYNNNSE